ncbi:MAG: glutathione peroxidase [Oscillospiraceae bacterium]|jgi:glutathione peroxidase|nr:glutathione peroxidase [Oscillospiraceae bacterium]
MSIYNITVKDAAEQDVSLDVYNGKVLLIVNTATHCGFTPQLAGLQGLYEKYHDKGFEVLSFPCNQFGKQAPGTNAEIGEFCSLKFHTTFPQFAKIDVNGTDESPLYAYLKAKQGGVMNSNIKWNFTKFLVNQSGEVIARFSSAKKPEAIEAEIEKLLKLRQ